MKSKVDSGDYNWAYLYVNGGQLTETEHNTHSSSGSVSSTSGREWILEAKSGDFITLRTTLMGGEYLHINFCVDFIPKM